MKLSYEQIREACYEALRALLGDSYSWSLIATFADSVIISRGPLKLERYSFTIETGRLALGTSQVVQIAYQPLTEGLSEARILGPMELTEATADKAAEVGREWAVCVIQEGMSGNRKLYTSAALQGAVALFEGAQVYWNHDTKSEMRDPRDIAGFLRAPQYALLEGRKPYGAILATFRATDERARTLLKEAFEAGNPALMGLSIHAAGTGSLVKHTDGRAAYRVDKIDQVASVDIVSKPAAGGRFLRLVAGLPAVPVTEEDLMLFEQKLKMLRESRPDLAKKLGATPTEADVDGLLMEALTTPAPLEKTDPAPIPAAPTPTPAPAAAPAPVKADLSEADRSLMHELRVDRVLIGRTMPDAIKVNLRESLISRVGATEAELKVEVDRTVAMAAKMEEGIRGSGLGQTTEVTKDEADKIQQAWHGFFAGADVDKAPRFTSLREGYRVTTGDQALSGRLVEAKGIKRFERLLEGLDSTSFGSVLGNSITRQLVANYNAQGGAYADWGRGWLCSVVPVSDFRTQDRTRFGGYGNLSIVPEGQPYQALTSPTDEKAQYAVAKRGGTESLTFEMIRNDDVGAVREIPRRMARASLRTLYEFVLGLMTSNPTIYDTVALFHGTHANTTTSALSSSTWLAARLTMLKQTEKDSGKRLGILPRHLAIPPDLEGTARELFRRDTNNDPKFIQDTVPEIHIITHTTDTADWFVLAGTDQVPQIELAFLDGREEPETFVADIPNSGSLFSADKIDYKLRHVYGGAWVDYRGAYGGMVP